MTGAKGPSLLESVVAGRAPGVLPLTVAQFHRMVEQGVLADGEPVELIEGVLVRKDRGVAGEGGMVHGKRHALAVAWLQRLDRRLVSLDVHLRSQLPLTLSEHDEPEPDAALVRGTAPTHPDRHPGPPDVLVVLEVADSSLDYDRSTKQQLYARAGIAQYVLINLVDGVVELYEQPDAAGAYARRAVLRERDVLRLSLDTESLEIPLSELLPPKS